MNKRSDDIENDQIMDDEQLARKVQPIMGWGDSLEMISMGIHYT
jgi:hypothetical protein